MSTTLSQLKNTTRPFKKRKLLGRGPGSGKGKTCGRGHKGDGSRSGYKQRHGYEGGQLPLYKKLPTRGFTRGAFIRRLDVVNLGQIDALFQDGEEVNLETLHERGFLSGPSYGLKILAKGELTKKVTITAHAYSTSAHEKLTKAGIECKLAE